MKSLINFAAVIIICLLMSCTDEQDFLKGKRQLEAQGYTEVKSTGYSAFCCDEKDSFSNGFTAKDKYGNTVEGCICSGLMKGITIRYK